MARSYERSFYRIPYPYVEGPRLVVGTQVLQVLDCSERGLRFRAEPHSIPRVGEQIVGRLRFPRGVEVEVEGEVIRVQDREVALGLMAPGVPFRIILQEQIYIRKLRPE